MRGILRVRKTLLVPLLPMLVIATSFLSIGLLLAIRCCDDSCGPSAVRGDGGLAKLTLCFTTLGTIIWADSAASFFSFGMGFIAYWSLKEAAPPKMSLHTLFLRAVVLLLVQICLTIMIGTQWSGVEVTGLLPFWMIATCSTALWVMLFHRYRPFPRDEPPQRLTLGRVAAIFAGIAVASLLLWCIKSWIGATLSVRETPSAAVWITEATVFQTLEYALLLSGGTVLPIVFCYFSLVACGIGIAVLYPPADQVDIMWAITCGVGSIAVPLWVNTQTGHPSWITWLIRGGVLAGWFGAIWVGSMLHRVRWNRKGRDG